MFKCLCGKQFKTWRSLNSHFSRICIKNFKLTYDGWYALYKSIFGDNVDSIIEEYKNEKICCADLESWSIKLITLLGLKRTHSQEKLTNRYKNKIETTLLIRYGVNNASKCEFVKQKKKQKIIETFGSLEKWKEIKQKELSLGLKNIKDNDSERWNEIRENIKKGVHEKYGVDNVAKVPEIAKKIRESTQKRMLALSFEERQNLTKNARLAIKRDLESNLEIKIQHILNDLKIPFEKHLNIGNRNYDIIIRPNIIIECQGDYWHANPSIYKETDILYNGYTAHEIWKKDEYKKELANKHGFFVIPLWESDINLKNEKELIYFIKQEIENVQSTII